MRISIVLPVLNEAASLPRGLQDLQPWRQAGHEVVVVDGGSHDASVALARPLADAVIQAPRGRASQMNAGARRAGGEVLLFLHADTRLPPDAAHSLVAGLRQGACWGRFDVRLSGERAMFRLIERLMNWRSRWSGIATGDQAIFMTRAAFEQVGGFPPIPLMEDIAISKRLKGLGRPLCLRGPALTSSRRWEQNGVWRTVLLMWRLRLAYFLGADPARLARQYSKS